MKEEKRREGAPSAGLVAGRTERMRRRPPFPPFSALLEGSPPDIDGRNGVIEESGRVEEYNRRGVFVVCTISPIFPLVSFSPFPLSKLSGKGRTSFKS